MAKKQEAEPYIRRTRIFSFGVGIAFDSPATYPEAEQRARRIVANAAAEFARGGLEEISINYLGTLGAPFVKLPRDEDDYDCFLLTFAYENKKLSDYSLFRKADKAQDWCKEQQAKGLDVVIRPLSFPKKLRRPRARKSEG